MKNNIMEIESNDFERNRRITLSVAELKVINNILAEQLENYPEMVTYQSIVDKVSENLENDCECDMFYGVNSINNVDWMYSDVYDEVEVALDLNVQSTETENSEDIVLFFSFTQMKTIERLFKTLKKAIKDSSK